MFSNLVFIVLIFIFFLGPFIKIIILFNFTFQSKYYFLFLCQFWSSFFWIFFDPFTKLIFVFNFILQSNIRFILFFNFYPHYFNWYCRTSKKIRAASAGDLFCYVLIWLVRWSRHLVIDWGLLGNQMYWSCQRFASKGLVVVRKGISTPNAPYLR